MKLVRYSNKGLIKIIFFTSLISLTFVEYVEEDNNFGICGKLNDEEITKTKTNRGIQEK